MFPFKKLLIEIFILFIFFSFLVVSSVGTSSLMWSETYGGTDKEVGLIELDALYSPIKHVGFHVEDTRVGQITNYDKVTLTIETDGTITPKEAVEQSSQILINHFNLLAGDIPAPVEEAEVTEEVEE